MDGYSYGKAIGDGIKFLVFLAFLAGIALTGLGAFIAWLVFR